MSKKHTQGMAIVGGADLPLPGANGGLAAGPAAGLFGRIARALWAPAASPASAAPRNLAPESSRRTLLEKEFATEKEALAFLGEMQARGYVAEIYQDVYDYVWHVDVYSAGTDIGE